MARNLLVLFAVCVLPAIVSAHFVRDPFHVTGCVYCDTCRCGYETDATTYMAVGGSKITSHIDHIMVASQEDKQADSGFWDCLAILILERVCNAVISKAE
ncbi:UNVERIFIED_CONTAM: hypothetical protein Scaly_2922400 [Sesamum calycinum]|uniref:Uncharacterized protein n=1 Tax=Sesamum calycinum TaxID=2727403 RepID=A0AAW2KYG3_9LAMI